MKKSVVTQSVYSAALVLAACGAAMPVLANEAGNFYAEIDLGVVDVSGPGPGKNTNFVAGQRFKDSDSTYGISLGYSFTDWFAIELGATDFGDVTDSFKLRDDVVYIVMPNDTQTLEAKGLSLTGVFSQNLGDSWTVQGLLGIAAMDYDSTLSGGFSEQTGSLLVRNSYDEQGLVYGLGVTYGLTESLSLRVAARRYDVGDFKLDTTSLGVAYSF